MATTDYEDLINRLGRASLETKSVIREAHQASRDLTTQIREARAALSSGPVEDRITSAVEAELKRMGDDIAKHTHEVYDNVMKQFDILTKPMMSAIDAINQHLRQMDLEISTRQQILRDMG